MTVTADPQSTPAMNGWATPQERDPATEIDRLRSERDLARAERDRVTADFESFKSQVATVGEEAARRHGWCGTYDAILDELGLSRPVRRVTGTITLTLAFTGTPADLERAMSHRFVRDSLQLQDMELAEWFDNDWQDMDITIDRDMVVISEVTMAADS
jgi:hypothetical protein